MFNVTRRQALAGSGGLISPLLLPQRFARAAVGSTLNIAYNVNLPSFDPDVGPSSVNPTIQAIYRSVFDQYVGQKPNLAFEPGLLTGWGWNDDKSKVWMDVRRERRLARRHPVHARRRRLVDPARGQAGRRQSGVVHLGQHRQLQGRRPAHHRRREAIRSRPVQMDGVPHRLRAAQGLLRESRPAGL